MELGVKEEALSKNKGSRNERTVGLNLQTQAFYHRGRLTLQGLIASEDELNKSVSGTKAHFTFSSSVRPIKEDPRLSIKDQQQH